MQLEIEARELDLPQGIERRVEGARAQQALQHVDRQRLAAVDVRGNERQHLGAPDEVLHELARQLDRVPGDAVDSGDAGIGHARQHVMQSVAELVKQRGDFVVRQQRGRGADRRREIADQLRDRQRRARGQRLWRPRIRPSRRRCASRCASTDRERSRRRLRRSWSSRS